MSSPWVPFGTHECILWRLALFVIERMGESLKKCITVMTKNMYGCQLLLFDWGMEKYFGWGLGSILLGDVNHLLFTILYKPLICDGNNFLFL